VTAAADSLARRLGLGDAVVLGLGSMIGAGVFVVLAPAARAAGRWLLVGLAVAGLVAFANATASAQLAARYPTSGGSYVYGRERLGPWAGFLAGWSFVVGKTASLAAMALTFAAYAAPPGWQRPAAVAVVVVLTAVGYRGVTRTARLSRVLVAVVLVVLGLVVVGGIRQLHPAASVPTGPGSGLHGILQSAGFWFFAFAGYARIATLGEEVRDPRRTVPRAIVLALSLTLIVYAALAVVAVAVLGVPALAASPAPVRELAAATGWPWLVPAVRVAGAAAAAGAIAALLAGVSRTGLAMAREGDLPRRLAAVHPRYLVPHRAELAVAVVVVVLVLTVDLRAVIGFSSFGVLGYYAVANLAALSQPTAERRYPRWFQLVGLAGCLALVAALPTASVLVGLVVLAVGAGGRAVLRANNQ
jgi:APA family basic amino acid/polyamine antiporter